MFRTYLLFASSSVIVFVFKKIVFVLNIYVNDFNFFFQYNEFKVRILKEKVHTPTTTVYKCGPLIDLCRGPHVRHTGKIKSFKITKVVHFCYQDFNL